MKAATRTKYGPPKVMIVKQVEDPKPGPREIAVRVHAATVNRTDCAILTGTPFVMRLVTGFFNPRHQITGTDFAGVVAAIGNDVSNYKVGDRVFGFDDQGLQSHAEFVVRPEKSAMAVIPENINFEQAAASLEGAHYAYNFVTKVNVRAGDKVLVNGATGAIGSAAVAILKHLGAEVTVVCPGSQFDAVRALGADHLIDFTKVDFTKDDSTRDSGKFAFVFDAVGKSQFAKCRPILEKRGVYISSELGPNSENLFYSAVTPLLMGKRVVFPVPVDIMRTIRFLLPLLETGKFVPLIDRSFSLDNIGEAYEYVASGQKIGNVVLKI